MWGNNEKEDKVKAEDVVKKESTYSVDVYCGKDESNFIELSKEEADKLDQIIKSALETGSPKFIGESNLYVVVDRITSWQVNEEDDEVDEDGESYY